MLKELQREWPGIAVTFRSDDISRPTDWRIHEKSHAVVVHLGGMMRCLQTELDGFGGSTAPASPGEVWTAPAERRYASHACGGQIHYAVLMLDPAVRDQISGTQIGRVEIAPLAGHRDEFLHQSVRQLQLAAATDNDVSKMLAESLGQTIALYLCRTYMGMADDPRRKARQPVLSAEASRQLREFIHENLCEKITLSELSRLAGLTTHQLLISFRQTFGTTPAQYVIQQRLHCAQRLLAGTKKDITTIALDCGFSSHSHLTSCFAKQLGCSPTKFRAQRRA